jgi:N-acetylglucosamine-6-sulfatase
MPLTISSPTLRRGALAAALAAAALLAVPAAAPAQAGPERPNIVFVLTDDLTADLLAFMPAVRRLSRRGVTFSSYFVSNSLCCPARVSLLTGRYPHATGVRTNVWPTGGWEVFARNGGERRTYATDLRRRGYRTAMFGKYLNEYWPRSRHVPPGWHTWAVSGKGYHNFDYNLNVNGRVVRHGRRPRDYLTRVIARRSARFIRESARAGTPFFVQLSTFSRRRPRRATAGGCGGWRSPAPARGTARSRTAPRGSMVAGPSPAGRSPRSTTASACAPCR